MIDFESPASHLLLNPRLPADERARLEALVPPLESHVFISTSGSTGVMKLVALSKAALLASARAVNERMEITARDVWAAVIPPFHVGGLGIYARSHVSGCRVLAMEWDPIAFAASESTVASLVPAQVHDLLERGCQPSSRLRAVLVGAAALDPDLDRRALAAGWPLLASYGMSECGSTIAIRDEVLSHVEARTEADGRIALRSASLLTGYATEEGFVDPKVDGWFVTADVGSAEGRHLTVAGRVGDFVKIGGELVSLARLDQIAWRIAGDDAAVIAVADRRLGFVIHLVVTRDADRLRGEFDEAVLPFERARQVHLMDAIPRSPLGKLLRAELTRVVEQRLA